MLHSLQLATNADVYLTLDPIQNLRLVGDDNIIPIIETVVRGDGPLEIFSDKNYWTDTGKKIYISLSDIRGLSISGSGTIQGQAPFEANTLSLNISGSGAMELTVNAGQINSAIPGSGTIKLSGNVYCKRTPSITSNISGSGNI